MRLKRYKKIQRHMGFFEKKFLFRHPFQILMDGTFANAALVTKVNIQDQLPKYLNAQVKLLTSPCIVTETEQIGPQAFGALQILKQFPTHKCTHNRTPVEADKCVLSMVGSDNPNRYIVATQDSTLRDRLRQVPGVAILYLHGNAPTLEKPSEVSIAHAKAKSLESMEVLDYQKNILNTMKKSVGVETGSGPGALTLPIRKGTIKRKRAGPNPLSRKKPKKTKPKVGHHPQCLSHAAHTSSPSTSAAAPKKRKRIKVRIPEHVKAERRRSSQGQGPSKTSASNDQDVTEIVNVPV